MAALLPFSGQLTPAERWAFGHAGNEESDMQLGMIGLGRMGANMVRRLMRGGHQCVVYDVHPEAVQKLVGEGAVGATTLDEFVKKLTSPAASG